MSELLALGLTIYELDENLIDIASNLAFTEKITFYDAVYVALAKNLQGTFITADKELLRQLDETPRRTQCYSSSTTARRFG